MGNLRLPATLKAFSKLIEHVRLLQSAALPTMLTGKLEVDDCALAEVALPGFGS